MGSTIRKRKMYEEFLSKVSILGKQVFNVFASITFSQSRKLGQMGTPDGGRCPGSNFL